MKQEETNGTSAFEAFLYTLIGVVVVIVAVIAILVAVLGEWVILVMALFAAIGLGWFFVWVTSGIWVWLWAKIGDKREDWADRRLNREVIAATTRSQLLLEDKRSHLVYAQDGFMPVAYNQILSGVSHDQLLQLAAQRIETLRLPENVPNTFHYHVVSDTAQTLNQGANVPSVTGGLGDLSLLSPGSHGGKLKLIEDEVKDANNEQ